MHILLARHGESVDDLTDQYGGWADFSLTPRGVEQLKVTSQKIQNSGIKFKVVITSPLKRAIESGRIIANNLSIPQIVNVYLKEKNGYGLLSGLNKDYAIQHYPELVHALENGYVYGAEPHDKFRLRVVEGFKKLVQIKQNVIAVTHGGFLKELISILMAQQLTKIGDGGFILLQINQYRSLLQDLNRLINILEKGVPLTSKDLTKYITVKNTYQAEIKMQ